MSERAWPFENQPEGGGRIRNPHDYAARHGDGTEAVIVRIGMNDAQLVLVSPEGAWDRWVYHSVDEAKEVAESLAVPVHVGEYPEELRVRINSYQRPPRDFDRAAYPEQGRVGPTIPYPENRPRQKGPAARKELAQEPEG
ncbi:MAG TPA: hypothetical protein VG929_06125 [Actinomycetota bacterium]|nr:hypothetical protein [Actinomycetota bacterium]